MAETQITPAFTTPMNFTIVEIIELKVILSLRKDALEKQLAGLPKEMAASREVVEDWLTKVSGLIETVEQADRISIMYPRERM